MADNPENIEGIINNQTFSKLIAQRIALAKADGNEILSLDIPGIKNSPYHLNLTVKVPEFNSGYYSLHCNISGGHTNANTAYVAIQNFLKQSQIGRISWSSLEVGLENGQRMIVDYLFKPNFTQRSFKFSFYSIDEEKSTDLMSIFAKITEHLYGVIISSKPYNPKESTPFFEGNRSQGECSRVTRALEKAGGRYKKDQRIVRGEIDQTGGILRLDPFVSLLSSLSEQVSYVDASLKGKHEIEIKTNPLDSDSVPEITLTYYKTREDDDFYRQLDSIWQLYSRLTNTRMAEAQLALTISAQKLTLVSDETRLGSFFQVSLNKLIDSENIKPN